MPEAGLVVEGATRIAAAARRDGQVRGPAPRSRDEAFYNPAMAVNRDLSVRLVAAYAAVRGRSIEVADVLAGTGARALRIANEAARAADCDVTVFASDGDPKAVAAMHKGVDANGLDPDRLHVSRANAFAALASRRFDIVDVDPFGPAAPFLDAAVRATRHDGLVCLTTTDTAALCGTYPRVCRRRYAAIPVHGAAWRAEAGLRILQAAVIAAAGRLDRDAAPVFAVSRGHWMRVVMRVRDGTAAADRRRREVAAIGVDEGTGLAIRDGGDGPLFWGRLHDPSVVSAMGDYGSDAAPETAGLVDRMVAEATLPAFWLAPADASSRMRTDTPRRDRLLRALAEAGFTTGPTHLDRDGIRTDAGPEDVRAAWASLL